MIDGIQDTFIRDGAIPLLIGRDESEPDWQAHRQWLKYESERIKAEYNWQQKTYELSNW